MKFGIWTPLPHTIRSEPRMEAAVAQAITPGLAQGEDLAFAFAVEVLQEAERLGFETSLVAERFAGPDLESWMLASALATKTNSIELIVAVHPGMISPQVAAKMAVTLDRISGGRAAINVVNGWWEAEFRNFSNGGWLGASEDRYRRMREFMLVARGLWTEDALSFDGEFFQVADGALPNKPVGQRCPAIYAASSGDAGRDMIAEFGDCWFMMPTTPKGYLAFDETLAKVASDVDDMKARALRFGRTVRFGISGHVIAAATDDEAHAKALELEAYGAQSVMNRVVALAASSGFVGSYRTVADRLMAYEALGIDTTMLHFHPMIEGMRTFAEQVLPLMQRAPALPLAI